jgi:hypothetical protein
LDAEGIATATAVIQTNFNAALDSLVASAAAGNVVNFGAGFGAFGLACGNASFKSSECTLPSLVSVRVN